MNLICGVCIMWNICCIWLLLSCFTYAEIANNAAGNETLSNITSPNKSTTAPAPGKEIVIPSEGGGTIISTAVPTNTSLATSENKINNPQSTISKVPSGNGDGDTTHASREGSTARSEPNVTISHTSREGTETQSKPNVTATYVKTPTSDIKNNTKPIKDNSTKTNVSNSILNSTLTDLKPGTEYEMGLKNDNKTSVPKKDPKMEEPLEIPQSSVAPNVTKPREKPKKPLITEATDDFLPSNFISNNNNKLGESKKENSNNVPSLEKVEQRQHKNVNYVVPIVGVILSVPLVAVIISVLYKRTAEWWHHRHYRRMDFLIEGMYNT